MNSDFSQPEVMYQVSFETKYRYVEAFEQYFNESDILSISSSELHSSTIESEADDLWVVDVLFANEPALESLQTQITTYASANGLEIYGALNCIVLAPKDWVTEYQMSLKPFIVGRFFIGNRRLQEDRPEDKIALIIEASRAFGTGEHSTTSLCIQALEAISNLEISNILDVGTGSGILSFASEKIWPNAKILSCDIEESAIETAKINAEMNNSKACFYQNQEDDLLIPKGNKFDLIISNILAKPLIQMAPELTSYSSNGTIILSGFLDNQMEDVIRTYRALGYKLLSSLSHNQWRAIILRHSSNLDGESS
jgi:ribosomal protein L11 methyltransferase